MSDQKWWHNLEKGQALMEYWPTIPAAIMIIISAGLVVSFLKGGFGQTADALNRSSAGIEYEQCETTEEQESGPDLAIVNSNKIELVSTSYDGTNTTVVYRVTEEKTKGNNGVGNGEDGQPPGAPPVNDGEGTSPGNPGNKGGAEKTEVDTTIVINFNIPQSVSDNIIDQSETWTYNSGVEFSDDKTKGNNGVGNGEDGQPPGEPPVNDGEGTSPGNPGNKGGAGDDADESTKGNNGVGNGEDPQPPGEPPVNDGEGTSPGNPGNKGGADNEDKGNKNKRTTVSSRMMNIYLFQVKTTTSVGFEDGQSREITLILSGKYDFSSTAVTVTSGGTSETGSISAPVQVIDQGHTQTTVKEECN